MSRTVVLNNKFIPSDFLPIGFLGYLPYSAVPAGWLICDGTVYSISDYPELAARLGNTYGGDGVTTFAVPDDRGLFRRDLDLSKGYDVGRALGSEQVDDFKSHMHTQQDVNASSNTSYVGSSGGMMTHQTINTGATGGTETRPKNRAYVPIIKAKNIYYDMTIQGGNAASLGGNPASYYAASSQCAKYTDFTGSFAANGYRRLPDETIIQWGSGTYSNAATVTFPLAFPVACYCVVVSAGQASNLATGAYNATTSQYTIVVCNSASGAAGTANVYWQAVGR